MSTAKHSCEFSIYPFCKNICFFNRHVDQRFLECIPRMIIVKSNSLFCLTICLWGLSCSNLKRRLEDICFRTGNFTDVIRRTELKATLHAYLNSQLDLAVSREVFDPSDMLIAKVDQDSFANDRRLEIEVIIDSDENSSRLLEALRIFYSPVDVS